MKRLSTMLAVLFSASFLVLLAYGCSDDDPTGGNREVDTTPPGVASVTAVDALHVAVVFNEAVEKNSAEDTDNYLFIEGPSPSPYTELVTASPGDTLLLASAVLGGYRRTVTITSWSDMADAPYNYQVTGVKDLSGNTIATAVSGGFDGSADPDLTSPTVVSQTPASGATGVPSCRPLLSYFPKRWTTVPSPER